MELLKCMLFLIICAPRRVKVVVAFLSLIWK